MNNSQIKSNTGDLITFCPYCKATHALQFQILDLHIYTNFKNNEFTITLKKSYKKSSDNETYIKTLLLNSLKKKPFIARVIITKSYRDVITELIKLGFLTNRDLDKINIY